MTDFAYRAVLGVARLALSYYYEEVEVHAAAEVPPSGPLLILANHQISLVDPLLLAHAVPRPVRFLAKASLFAIPGLAPLMRRVGAIGVHRREDGRANHDNTALYDAIAEALIDGAAIGIFPEGVSHDNPMLGAFRHGAARIALDTEDRADFDLGLQVLIVGIHIEDSRLFRGRVLVNVARPFSVRHYGPAYRADPHAAIERLTVELKAQLSASVLEAESFEDLQLAGLIESLDLLHHDEPGMHGAFTRKKFILEQYRRLRDTHPAQVRLIRELLILYRDALAFEPPTAERQWLFSIVDLLRRVVFIGPVIALGLATNALPFLCVRALAIALTRVQHRGQDVRASLGIMLGVPIFFGWYALLGWWTYQRFGLSLALLLVTLSPLAGLTAVTRLAIWKNTLRRLLVSLAGYLTRHDPRSTDRMRQVLREQIAKLYAQGRAGDAPR